MPDVWERRLSLEVLGHHGSSHALPMWRGGIALVVLLVISATVEVRRSFVLVRPAMIGVSRDQLSHVAGRVLVQFLVLAEDEDGDIHRAQDGELMCLLEETALAFQEGDRAVSIILDSLDFDLSATHLEGFATLGAYRSDATEVGDDNRQRLYFQWVRPCGAGLASQLWVESKLGPE